MRGKRGRGVTLRAPVFWHAIHREAGARKVTPLPRFPGRMETQNTLGLAIFIQVWYIACMSKQ
jgi:hypothetical protein